MTPSPYLDLLDAKLASGLHDVSTYFADAQVAFVEGCQQPDGGFRGRQGGSDLYYTDFALRTLALLAAAHPAFARAADWLDRQPATVSSVVECFSLLSIRHTLEQCAAVNAQNPPLPPFRALPAVEELLRSHLLLSGGLARFPGDARLGAYHTFLGTLCFQMLGETLPGTTDAVRAVEALQRADGGYAELAGQTASQTNATAAAVAFLMMHDALSPADAAAVQRFLARMQAGDGGLMAHAAAGGGDLLSTFTGLTTLTVLDGVESLDTAAMGNFLRDAAHPRGGFLACAGDDSPDVEYTYYGTAVLALLRMLHFQ